jgi:release factor glutamine methyltransferase
VATLQELYRRAAALLGETPQPGLEAKLLILYCTRLKEEKFLADPERAVSALTERRLLNLIQRRKSGVPLAYLTKIREFWSLPFRVGPGVLIPRPETELVVEQVLKLAAGPEGLILDVGTGSGNIALSLAKELPRFKVAAVDVSRRAVIRAQANAERLGLARVEIMRGSLFAALKGRGLEGRFDFIVSNPPYVSAGDWEGLDDGIKRYEPKRALVPGPTGLEFIKRLILRAPKYLKPDGFLIFEIGAGQDTSVLALFDSRWKGVERVLDLAGIPRVVIAQFRGRTRRSR